MSEEVDSLSLLALATAGVVVPKDIRSAGAFTPEALHAVLVQVLRIVASEDAESLPATLPANVAVRHRVATTLARTLKAAGFGGAGGGETLGYNQLLYPSERDVRRLLSWAVQRLPRAEEGLSGAGEARAGTASAALVRGFSAWVGGSSSSSGGGARRGAPAGLPWLEHLLSAGSAAAATAASSSTSRAARRTGGGDVAALLRAAASEAAAGGASSALPPGAALSLVLADPAAALPSTEGSAAASAAPPPPLPAWEDLVSATNAASGRRRGAGGAWAHGFHRHFPGTALDACSSAFNRRAAFGVEIVRGGGGFMHAPTSTAPEAAVAARAKTEEELAAEREEELAHLAARLTSANAEAEALASQHAALTAVLPSLSAQLSAAVERSGDLERAFLLRRAGLDMLPAATEHSTRLAAELAAVLERLRALVAEWEGHRARLTGSVAEEEAAAAAAAARLASLAAGAARMQSDMVDMATAAAGRDEQAARMGAELSRLQAAAGSAGGSAGSDGSSVGGADGGSGGLMTRATYTKLIMETVRGIRKQKAEIARIVGDVRRVQLELAAVDQGLKRIASVAGDTMEAAAVSHVKDANYRTTLRQLLTLQDTFGALVKSVDLVCAMENEARDLDNRTEQMAQRNDKGALEALLKDLAAIKEENAALETKLTRAVGQ